MKRLYKNWTFHNLISHPLMEIIWWVCRPFSLRVADAAQEWVHDVTIPTQDREGSPEPTQVAVAASRMAPVHDALVRMDAVVTDAEKAEADKAEAHEYW